MGTYFKSGSWNVVCDVCGREYKADQMRKRWDGLVVCAQDFEHRHIADFIRVSPEVNRVTDPRPEPDPVFVQVCTIVTRQARADLGTADCSTADFTFLPDGLT